MPDPTGENTRDLVEKPNPDNEIHGKFGIHEQNLLVFMAFSLMIGEDMGFNKVISTGTYGFEKGLGFGILYMSGYVAAH
jgi:hypothetical protein